MSFYKESGLDYQMTNVLTLWWIEYHMSHIITLWGLDYYYVSYV